MRISIVTLALGAPPYLDEALASVDAPADFINPCFEEGVDEQAARFFAAEAEDRINRAVRLDCGSFDY